MVLLKKEVIDTRLEDFLNIPYYLPSSLSLAVHRQNTVTNVSYDAYDKAESSNLLLKWCYLEFCILSSFLLQQVFFDTFCKTKLWR